MLLKNSIGPLQQIMNKMVITYVHFCVDLDINKALTNSMEIWLISTSWIQQLEYEALPFKCRLCHQESFWGTCFK